MSWPTCQPLFWKRLSRVSKNYTWSQTSPKTPTWAPNATLCACDPIVSPSKVSKWCLTLILEEKQNSLQCHGSWGRGRSTGGQKLKDLPKNVILEFLECSHSDSLGPYCPSILNPKKFEDIYKQYQTEIRLTYFSLDQLRSRAQPLVDPGK